MNLFLASLIFIAAGEVAPPPSIPDTEVGRYLKSNELIEWTSSMRANSAGETRVKTGQSIMKMSNDTLPANAPKAGSISETPEQIKIRAQKIIDEGNAQIQQALPSLVRLRAIAAVRAAEGDELLAPEAGTARSAVARGNVDGGFVDELHVRLDLRTTKPRRTGAPPSIRPWPSRTFPGRSPS
mgnify:CR=1 FL=1